MGTGPVFGFPGGTSEPWDLAPFSSDAKSVLAAAARQRVEPGAPAVVLLEEKDYSFDEHQRLSTRWHRLVQIRETADAESWSILSAEWAPWREERPLLRARVISPDGTVRDLDPKTIAESPVGEDSEDIFSDLRRVRAPLPAVAAGAILEEEIDTRDTEPFFAPGSQCWFSFGYFVVPALHTRATVRLPRALRFQYRLHDLPGIQVENHTEAERITWTFDQGAMSPVGTPEPHRPGDVAPQPFLVFSTVPSWRDAATAYDAIVDRQIGGADVKGLVSEIVSGSTGRRAIAEKLTEWLSKNVRYTGIEFGQSAIVPHRPEETLSRKFGDCKDKASLLVAMLRAAGIPASVALLNADAVMDAEPEMPGINVFDHAIVYAPGDEPLWIDPTDEFGRVGELPSDDQGRRALIAAASTDTLVVTPAASPEANLSMTRIEIRLAEEGAASARFEQELHGQLERNLRRTVHGTTPEKLREALQQTARAILLAKEIDGIHSADPADMGRPFRLEYEAHRAGRGQTDDFSAAAGLSFGGVTDDLPEEFRESPGDGDADGAGTSKARQRTNDYVLKVPFVSQWEFHVIPPDGFQPVAVPKDATIPLGPARLSESYVAAPDGSVRAVFRCEVAKSRFTPEELRQIQKDLAALGNRPIPILNFQLTAAARLQAGDVRAALADLRAAVLRAPRDPIPRLRLAQILSESGVGEPARQEAQEATRLAPGSEPAYRALARVLSRDPLGRPYHPGWDREGAVKAYRKALELDPEDNTARSELAILMEYDRQGTRYGESADLKGAVELYGEIAKHGGAKTWDDNCVIALFRAGLFAEALERIDKLNRTPGRDGLRLASVAAQQGAAAAIERASALVADAAEKRRALASAAANLVVIRRYPEAASLFSEAAKGDADSETLLARAELISKARRYEDLRLPEDDPTTPVRRLLITELIADAAHPESVTRNFSKLSADLAFSAEGPLSLQAEFASSRRLAAQQKIDPIVLADIVAGGLHFGVEGSDRIGYRIVQQGTSGLDGRRNVFFVKKEGQRYAVVAGVTNLSLLGLEAMSCVRANELESARKWLDWARHEIKPAGGDDPLAGSPFPRLWSEGEAGDPERIRRAAAALLVEGPAAEQALPVLLTAATAEADSSVRLDLDFAIASALSRLKKYSEYLPVGNRLLSAYPKSRTAFVEQVTALYFTDQPKALLALCQQRLSSMPDDPDATRALAEFQANQARYAESRELYRRLIDSGQATAWDYNNLAWLSLAAGPIQNEDLENARRGARMAGEFNSAALNTLAALYAGKGQCLQARQEIFASMEAAGRDAPNSADWFVFGLVYEQYGENEEARRAYARVEGTGEKAAANSVYTLARARREALGAP